MILKLLTWTPMGTGTRYRLDDLKLHDLNHFGMAEVL